MEQSGTSITPEHKNLESGMETKREIGLEESVAKYQGIELSLVSTLEGRLPPHPTIKYEPAPST